MAFERRAGLLLHPTSLPGPYGIGSLGKAAFDWLDFLEAAGQRLWQVMPLGPTGYGDSPYQSFSAFAGNPYLIDLDLLVGEGLLRAEDLADAPDFGAESVDYGNVIPYKLRVLERAFKHFQASATDAQRESFEKFCAAQASWLDDFALFMTLKEVNGGEAWSTWPADVRDRDVGALREKRRELAEVITRHKLWQWLFYEQWLAVKAYANAKDILVVGDIPIFIAYDSADAWANPELFYFDKVGNPTVIAGVPPDYFSATGQRWGNPLYRWDKMAAQDFKWWVQRVESTLDFFDLIRIDHFRGFEAYWEIPASEPTAVKGRWVKGPGQPLFDAIRAALGDDLPIIAEDLGVITPEVEKLRDDNHLPGMKVLQFAFAADASDPYLPHNYPHDCVVYTGTHDNDTTRGWYAQAPEAERDFVRRYLGRGDEDVVQGLVQLAFASVADTAVVPLQDVLSLGTEARMNTPGVAAGNWSWRFRWEQVPHWVAAQLKDLATLYARLPGDGPKDTPYRQSVTESESEG
ncbi:4-alpha-glucanotransferase [soil metagenome]